MPAAIKEGFRPLALQPGVFLAENGPLYGRRDSDSFNIGLVIGPQHGNAGGICHGGMMMAFADSQLVFGAMLALEDFRPLATINATFDFVRPGIIGGWLEGSTRLIRATRNTVFVETMLSVNGKTALRCSGILRHIEHAAYDPETFLGDEVQSRIGEHGAPEAPGGFAPIRIGGDFLDLNGPLHGHLEGSALRLGLRIEPRHCNTLGVCHGGVMMMLTDAQTAVGSMFESGNFEFMPTVHLNADFVASARVGDWLQVESRLLRQTRSLSFADRILSVDGEPVLRAVGINKRTKRKFAVVSQETLFI